MLLAKEEEKRSGCKAAPFSYGPARSVPLDYSVLPSDASILESYNFTNTSPQKGNNIVPSFSPTFTYLILFLIAVLVIKVWAENYKPTPRKPRYNQRSKRPAQLAPRYKDGSASSNPPRVQSGPLPYRKTHSMLSPREMVFYRTLAGMTNDRWKILMKVRLADIAWLPDSTPNRQMHFGKVMSKHVDFVLCDNQRLTPFLVIELDDESHTLPDRQERDLFVDSVMDSIRLPILHVSTQAAYDAIRLEQEITAALIGSQIKGSAPAYQYN
jgi:very-short-patch-repair endonuclease